MRLSTKVFSRRGYWITPAAGRNKGACPLVGKATLIVIRENGSSKDSDRPPVGTVGHDPLLGKPQERRSLCYCNACSHNIIVQGRRETLVD